MRPRSCKCSPILLSCGLGRRRTAPTSATRFGCRFRHSRRSGESLAARARRRTTAGWYSGRCGAPMTATRGRRDGRGDVDRRRLRQARRVSRVDGTRRSSPTRRAGFALCGMPPDEPVRVVATKESAAAGTIELRPSVRRAQRKDLLMASGVDSPASRGVVAGVVRDPAGAPIAGARVVTEGAAEVRSGSDGHFVLTDVPIGTREVDVLFVGSQPTSLGSTFCRTTRRRSTSCYRK